MRHVRVLLPLLLGSLLATGCKKRQRVSEPQCRARTAAMAEALRKVIEPHREDLTIENVEHVKLVPAKGAALAPYLPMMTVRSLGGSKEASVLFGSAVWSLEIAQLEQGRWAPYPPQEIVDELKHRLNDAPGGDASKRGLTLLVDRAIPWAVLAALTHQLAAVGVDRVGALVAVPDPAPLLPASKATAEIKAFRAELVASIDPRNNPLPVGRPTALQRRVTAHWQRATEHCPRIKKVFDEAGLVPPERKGRVIVDGVRQALVGCRCDADLPTIHALLHDMLHRRPTGVLWFQHDKNGPRVVRPASEPWHETVSDWLSRQPTKEIRGVLALER